MDKLISGKNYLLRLFVIASILAMAVIFCPIGLWASPIEAYTTANITITVTPGVIGISLNQTSWNAGIVYVGNAIDTNTVSFGIDNTSTVITNHSIGVTGTTWTGGATAWTHSNTATPGADTIGMLANKSGTWGVGDITIKSSSLGNIATNQAANTDYSFGLRILMPTSSTVTDQKTNVVQITVSAA